MASSGLELKEWSQVCGWGVRSLFGTEVSETKQLLGRKGKKHAVSMGPKEAGWGLAEASSTRGAWGCWRAWHISRVLLCHHSRKAGWEAGRELGKAGLLQGHVSWEGQEGHVRTRKTGLVPICCGNRAV